MFNLEFYLLVQECNLAKAALLGGLTAFSNVDVDKPGSLYSAFFQTSTGLERLMKVTIIVDYKMKHNLANPTNEQLKQTGHDLLILYDKCAMLAVEQSLDITQWFGAGTIEHDTLAFLSDFSKRSRYYNLDAISGGRTATDPLAQWARLHQRIAETYISYKFREKLSQKSLHFADRVGADGWERWVDGQYVSNIDAVYLHSLLRKLIPTASGRFYDCSNPSTSFSMFSLIKYMMSRLKTTSTNILFLT